MKHLSKLAIILPGLLTSIATVAQDASLKVNLNTDAGGDKPFYTQIWFWVILSLVFILLLVVLLRGNNKN
ncbi:MAG: hypothetical protein ACYC2P_00430 [Paludibacteraceae bacterium]